MQFEVTPVRRTCATVLQIAGELDVATVEDLRTAVGRALEDRPERLVVDLSDTGFIDSTGCRELVRTAKTGRARSVTVEVACPPDNWKVRRVLDLVQLSQLVTVHDQVPTA